MTYRLISLRRLGMAAVVLTLLVEQLIATKSAISVDTLDDAMYSFHFSCHTK